MDTMKLAEALMVMCAMEEDMSDVINLDDRRPKDRPDWDMVRLDDDGVEMFLYALEYEFNGSRWATNIWAYSMDEAQSRVDAMRGSLVLLGQMFSEVPA